MPYDRYGRTPDIARRERIGEALTIVVFAVLVAAVCTCAALVVAMLS